jgi:hypothetical protein
VLGRYCAVVMQVFSLTCNEVYYSIKFVSCFSLFCLYVSDFAYGFVPRIILLFRRVRV